MFFFFFFQIFFFVFIHSNTGKCDAYSPGICTFSKSQNNLKNKDGSGGSTRKNELLFNNEKFEYLSNKKSIEYEIGILEERRMNGRI